MGLGVGWGLGGGEDCCTNMTTNFFWKTQDYNRTVSRKENHQRDEI